jgi:hypothetical protein
MKKPDNTTIFLIIGGLLLLGGFGFGIKNLLNPTAEEDKSQDLRRRDLLKQLREILASGYYETLKKSGSLPMLNPAKLEKLATQIFNSMGFFNDDEAAINSAFQQLNTKFEAWALASTFNKKFNKDLFSFLADSLNQTEMIYLGSIIDPLKLK